MCQAPVTCPGSHSLGLGEVGFMASWFQNLPLYLITLLPQLQPAFSFWISLGKLLFELPLYWVHACLYRSAQSRLLVDKVPHVPH